MQVNRPELVSEHSCVTQSKQRGQLGSQRSVLQKFKGSIPMGTAEGKTQTDLNVESDRLRNGIYNQILLETAKTDLMIQCNAKMNSAAIT